MCVCVQVLAVRRLDHDYALALLLAAPPSTAVQSLKAIRTRSISSYSRVIVSLCINLNKSWVYIVAARKSVEKIKIFTFQGATRLNLTIILSPFPPSLPPSLPPSPLPPSLPPSPPSQAVCKLAIDYSLVAGVFGVLSVAEQSVAILCSAQWGKTLTKYKVRPSILPNT